MRRRFTETKGRGHRLAEAEPRVPERIKTVRASKAQPQSHATGTVTESESRITTSPDVIKKWAEERDGQPAFVKGAAAGEGAGLLRIDFPGYAKEDPLRKVSWPEWFREFESSNLAFHYQEKTKGGTQSHFFQLIKR